MKLPLQTSVSKEALVAKGFSFFCALIMLGVGGFLFVDRVEIKGLNIHIQTRQTSETATVLWVCGVLASLGISPDVAILLAKGLGYEERD